MPVDRRKLAVFGSAVALRVLLFVLFPALPDLLTGRVEVSTPLNSFKRCTPRQFYRLKLNISNSLLVQEGLFLYKRGVSPYDGGVFHQVSYSGSASNDPHTNGHATQAPILLPIFSLLPQSSYPLIGGLIYILLDVLSANALIKISDSGESVVTRLYTSPRKHIRWGGVAIAAG